ncbi:peptidylprolyl isomerase [Paracraurococcus lichenis]|uniref:Parvulin-like PPIase n=1 Tax=Paracraurococcus lichenis TaxID=3064888 RepID=A0ABT9DXG2_9PROT|nr:peptidylprolyl isomerase [Paracraurococcus sp. LOR1-02]MDO9708583.1 SurA N-terminal domain-containing protein [Paracraurococcus sp. LOR1-02]
MLTALRRLAGTWVAKALFVLLILSFGIWGIGDMARNLFAPDTSLARVAGQPVTLEEGQQVLRREMQRIARQLGGQFENDPRVRRALAEQAVDQLVLDRVLQAEAARLKLAVPDDAVREVIVNAPAFRGADGQFSRAVFQNYLRNADLTEDRLIASLRSDIAKQQIAMAIRSGAVGPDALAKPLMRWVEEQRTVTLVTLPTATAPEPPAPEEAQLRRFHENNPERFSSPEYREATVAVLTADLLSREVEVTEADIAAAYEARRSQYETPERRSLAQVLVPDEAKAREIAAAWTGGADFEAIAAQAQAAGGQALELGQVDRAGLPVPELATAAFAAPEGGVTAPVQSPFGWHVFKVEKVEAGISRPLAELHDQIKRDLAMEKAADIAFERANKVEDALAGGATVAEVAKQFGLGLATVRTDADGHDPEGKPVELPVIEASRAPLLKAVFSTEKGAAPRLQETEAGFVAIDVKEVIPPTLKPFESVEPAVRAAFEEDAKRREQEERAAALLKAAKDGKPLAEAAQEAGLGSREIGAVGRNPQQGAAVPQELLAPLFELPVKDATMVRTRDGFAVAQVVEITPGNPEADAAALDRIRRELEQSMAQDLEVQFLTALRARSDVRLNPRMLDALAQP